MSVTLSLTESEKQDERIGISIKRMLEEYVWEKAFEKSCGRRIQKKYVQSKDEVCGIINNYVKHGKLWAE